MVIYSFHLMATQCLSQKEDLNLGDNRILFSWGDLIICTCDPGDFLRFLVGGFSAFLPVAFRFDNKNFTVATAAMPLEAAEFPTS
jgi:hypothetical protein